MSRAFYQIIRRAYWSLPISDTIKEGIVGRSRSFYYDLKRKLIKREAAIDDRLLYHSYIQQVLSIPEKPSDEHVPLSDSIFIRDDRDPKVIAYYLPQFHPTPENDAWWGRGVTEWNNVSRAVPQYLGHYQPRLPGELGYYDLRLKQTLQRQIELAKLYGIFGFAFYHYWFDGKRLLDKPLDMFLNNHDLDFPFCLCWANESWTRRFDGSCGEVLIKQSETAESYRAFITSAIAYMRDPRYMRVGDRPILIIYRPSFVPECATTLNYWREACTVAEVGNPYIIGVKEHTWDADLLAHGFDAQSEFHPGTLFRYSDNITNEINFIRPDFGGLVLDYADIVNNQKYFRYSHKKLYRAVMPMWDNTARRNNNGMIFHGATPQLYRRWLKDVALETRSRIDVEEPLIFVNAWNEWGEGAYLEPDRRYGYAFLQATRDAIEDCRFKNHL